MKCDNCEALATYKHDPKIANVAYFCAPHLPVNLRSSADNYLIVESAPAPKKKSSPASVAEETASDE
jgi:hypothetical protein